jgi:hypothetical protein
MNRAERRVKIYACRNATRSSRQSMKMTKKADSGDTHIESKMNIRQIRLRTMIWPAVMFANNRIIRANGLEIKPISSTGIITGRSHKGTPGAAKTCLQ